MITYNTRHKTGDNYIEFKIKIITVQFCYHKYKTLLMVPPPRGNVNTPQNSYESTSSAMVSVLGNIPLVHKTP